MAKPKAIAAAANQRLLFSRNNTKEPVKGYSDVIDSDSDWGDVLNAVSGASLDQIEALRESFESLEDHESISVKMVPIE